jgi:dTDP-4-amino-4,6-dideoxygalactose transaminase
MQALPLFKVAMSPRAAVDVAEVLGSGYIGQGPRNDAFEAALAEVLGTPHVVTVSSATAGLHLALYMAMTAATDGSRTDLGRRTDSPSEGEVLSTPLTCTATNWPIVTQGIPLRWVDVDPATLNISPQALRARIGPRTKVVVVVHWGGYPVDLAALDQVLDEAEAAYGFRPVLVEDCAHAWGATYAGRRLGTHGNVSVFSFQAIKHLTCGDGGAVVLPTHEAAERARRLRWYGIDRRQPDGVRWQQDVPEAGFKFQLNDIAAAIGLANLDLAEHNVTLHRNNAAFYDEALRGVDGLNLLERRPGHDSSAWIYSLRVDRRDDFIAHLARSGIAASAVHMRNDVHSCVAALREPLPGVDIADTTMVSIPVGWWVDQKAREAVVSTIRRGW